MSQADPLGLNSVCNKGPARLLFEYDESDRVIREEWGGTNANGVPAGGAVTFQYEELLPPGDGSQET